MKTFIVKKKWGEFKIGSIIELDPTSDETRDLLARGVIAPVKRMTQSKKKKRAAARSRASSGSDSSADDAETDDDADDDDDEEDDDDADDDSGDADEEGGGGSPEDAETRAVVDRATDRFSGILAAAFDGAVTRAVAEITSRLNSAVSRESGRSMILARKRGLRPRIFVGESREFQDPMGGYKCAGHFLMDVRDFSTAHKLSSTAKRWTSIVQKATDGHTEAIGEDGGLLVPPEISDQIYERAFEEPAILGQCDAYQVRGNTLILPRARDDSRKDGYRHGGVVGYWIGETDSITLTKALQFSTLSLRLNKFGTLAKMSDELLADTPLAEQFLVRNIAREIAWQLNYAIWEGDGKQKPLGVKNSPCCLKVPRAVASVVSLDDLGLMWSGMPIRSLASANWYTNHRMPFRLMQIHVPFKNMAGNENVSGTPIYIPPGGLAGLPYGTMLGRPVREIEFAHPLGTEGDLSFMDFSEYVILTKGAAGPPAVQTAMSIHMFFDTDQTAFRSIVRIDGQPWWPTTCEPFRGEQGEVWSPFVMLTDHA